MTQDSDPEALSIRLSRSSSPSLGSAEYYQTGGDNPFPERAQGISPAFKHTIHNQKCFERLEERRSVLMMVGHCFGCGHGVGLLGTCRVSYPVRN